MGSVARTLQLHGGIPAGRSVDISTALNRIYYVDMTDSPDITGGGTTGAVDFQVRDFLGAAIDFKCILGLEAKDPDAGDTTKPGALAAAAVIGGATTGIELAGDDSNTLVVETDATGAFVAVLTNAADTVVFVTVKPVGGSPLLDCREFDTVEFSA